MMRWIIPVASAIVLAACGTPDQGATRGSTSGMGSAPASTSGSTPPSGAGMSGGYGSGTAGSGTMAPDATGTSVPGSTPDASSIRTSPGTGSPAR